MSTIKYYWQLPARGDGRLGDAALRLRGERRKDEQSPFQKGVSDPRGTRFNYFDYLHQVARAAELSVFDGIRIPHDPRGDESWIIAGYVARDTRRLTLLTEFEAAWGSAVYAAKNAISVQRYTGGRMAWQLSAGRPGLERNKAADPVWDADVLPRIEEFVNVARGVITTAPFSFKGRFFEVRDGGFKGTLANHPAPLVFLNGETPEAYALSARTASVHVFPALEPEQVSQRIRELGALVQSQRNQDNAPLEYAVRLDLIARETEAEAQFDAERFAKQSSSPASTASSHALWRGLGNGLTDAEATFVGSYEQASDLLQAYAAVGVTHFLLGAVPHLEEAYRIGTHLLPTLRHRLARASAA